MQPAVAFAAATAGLALLLGASRPAARGSELPPPAHTGGYGEPTCAACHLPASPAPAPGPGTLALTGVPDRYEAGVTYRIVVTLAHTDLRAGGFQLATRGAEGAQAGDVAAAPADSARVGLTEHGGITYAHHTYAGTRRTATDTTRWTVLWTAPADSGPVTIHVAANAADDDASPLGDVIYLTAVRIPAADSAAAIVPHARFP